MTLKQVIYKTLHHSKISISEIADELGLSESSLYRWGLPEPSGSKMPLEYLLPLMRVTRNYGILKHIANRAGFLLVKMPRVAKNKKKEREQVFEYSELTTKAVRKLIEYFEDPTLERRQEIEDILIRVAEESISIKKGIERGFQLELLDE